MTNQNWRKVGKIKNAHGLRGEIEVLVFSKDVSWARQLKVFGWSHSESELTPQMIEVEKARPLKDGLIIKPSGLSDRSAAEALKGAFFFLPEDFFQSKKGETIFLSEIQGFALVNAEEMTLGRIVGFSSNLAQDLLVIEKPDGKKAEVPFVSDFLVDLDFDQQLVKMNLPEGLLDLDSL